MQELLKCQNYQYTQQLYRKGITIEEAKKLSETNLNKVKGLFPGDTANSLVFYDPRSNIAFEVSVYKVDNNEVALAKHIYSKVYFSHKFMAGLAYVYFKDVGIDVSEYHFLSREDSSLVDIIHNFRYKYERRMQSYVKFIVGGIVNKTVYPVPCFRCKDKPMLELGDDCFLAV